jgi:hypothetical protein
MHSVVRLQTFNFVGSGTCMYNCAGKGRTKSVSHNFEAVVAPAEADTAPESKRCGHMHLQQAREAFARAVCRIFLALRDLSTLLSPQAF